MQAGVESDSAKSRISELPTDGQGESDLDRFTGELTERVPIEVPKFHGIEPKIELHYHSGQGNGFVGEGWSLTGLSSIERVGPGKGAPNNDANDVFLLDNEELIPCVTGSASPSCTPCPSGSVCYSTKVESYRRIARNTSTGAFTVWDKDGTQTQYTATMTVQRPVVSCVDQMSVPAASGGLPATAGSYTALVPIYTDMAQPNGSYFADLYCRYNPPSEAIPRFPLNGNMFASSSEVRFNYDLTATTQAVRYRIQFLNGARVVAAYQGGETTNYLNQAMNALGAINRVDVKDNILRFFGFYDWGFTPALPNQIAIGRSVVTSNNNAVGPGVISRMWVSQSASGHNDVLNVEEQHCDCTCSTPGCSASDATKSCSTVTRQITFGPVTGTGYFIKGWVAGVAGRGNFITVYGYDCDNNNVNTSTTNTCTPIEQNISLTGGVEAYGSWIAAGTLGRITNITTSTTSPNTLVVKGYDNCSTATACSGSKTSSIYFNGATATLGTTATQAQNGWVTGITGSGNTLSVGTAAGCLSGTGCTTPTSSSIPLAPALTTVCTVSGTQTVTYRWLASRVQDTRGNTVDYNYAADGTDWQYIDNIQYNGAKITFHREARPDVVTRAAGGMTTMRYRLKTIDVQVGANRARAYALSYSTFSQVPNGQTTTSSVASPTGGLRVVTTALGGMTGSLLTAIQRFGTDAVLAASGTEPEICGVGDDTATCVVGGTPAPQMTLEYAQPNASYIKDASGRPVLKPAQRKVSATGFASPWRGTLSDVDGDGVADALATYIGGTGAWSVRPQLSNKDGTWADKAAVTIASAGYGAPWKLSVADFDADGDADLVATYIGANLGWKAAVARGNGDGTFAAPVVSTFAATGFPAGWVTWTADVNGDGRADLVANYASASGWSAAVALSDPATGTFVYKGVVSLTNAYMGVGWVTRSADVNGDGRTDLLASSIGGGWDVFVALSNGDGTFKKNRILTLTQTTFTTGWTDDVADVNGDGRADLVATLIGANTGWSQRVALSNGDGTFTAGGALGLATSGFPAPWTTLFGDVNGDGKDDAIAMKVGNNTGWRVQVALSDGAYGFHQPAGEEVIASTGYASPWAPQVADINGDGKLDLVAMKIGNNAGWYIQPELATGSKEGLIKKVSNGHGASKEVAYLPSAIWANGYLPFSIPTVSRITTNDGRGHLATTFYSYSGGKYDPLDRRFLGFAYSKAIFPANAEEIARPYEETWFNLDVAARGGPTRRDRRDGNAQLLSSEVFEYTTAAASVPYQTLLTGYRRYLCDGLATCKQVYTTYGYDAYGNRIWMQEYGDNDVAGDELFTVTNYAANAAAYIVGLPGASTTYVGIGSGGAVARQNLTYYDGAIDWSTPPVIGNPTMRRRWLNTTNAYLSRNTTFDAAGNVRTETDELGHATTTDYDLTSAFPNVFPVRVTNALNQIISTKTWDPVCGVVTSDVGPNGPSDQVATIYDPLCRPSSKTKPLGATTTWSYCEVVSDTNQCGCASIGSTTPAAQPCTGTNLQFTEVNDPSADGNGAQWQRTYVDGVLRPWLVASKGPSAEQTIYVSTEYSLRGGGVEQQSDPYYAGASPPLTITTYDALDRLVQRTHPNGATESMLRSQWTVTGVDAMGHQSQAVFDAFDNVVVSRSLNGATWISTIYAYGPTHKLVQLDDAAGNRWTYTYDSLDRGVAMRDPDRGSWTYSYNDDDTLFSQTDAKGQVTRFGYDALHRKTAKTLLFGTPQAQPYTWTYDVVRAGYANVGRLATQTEPTGNATFDYDLLGNLSRTIKTISGVGYTTSFGFDAGNRLRWVTFPDGDTAGTVAQPMTYDGAGRPRTIPGIVNAATWTARGDTASISYANGVVSNWTYDVRGALASLVSRAGQRGVQNLTYTRDLEGKLTRIDSPYNDEGWSLIGYDPLDRMTSATNATSAAENVTFTYDAVDNIISNSRLGTYTYPAPGPTSVRPHAVTTAGTGSYVYDANGNMTTRPGMTLGWDGANRMTSAGGSTFQYGADDERVTQTTAGSTTSYVTPWYTVEGGKSTKHIRFGGRLVAVRAQIAPGSATWTTTWLHADYLGSTQVITDGSGAIVKRLRHRLFGERY